MSTTLLTKENRSGAALRDPRRPGRNRQLPGFVNMGTTLLLVVFLVITLVVLALLALSGARNDLEFSRRLAQQNENYYSACSRAEEIYCELDRQLKVARENNEELNLDPAVFSVENGEISWKTDVDKNRVLAVSVDSETGRLLRWEIVSVRPWNGDDQIVLP